MAILSRIDPMVRLLIAAIALAVVLPVSGGARNAAQFVSNAAVFLLFFLNGLRLPRHEVMAGLGTCKGSVRRGPNEGPGGAASGWAWACWA